MDLELCTQMSAIVVCSFLSLSYYKKREKCIIAITWNCRHESPNAGKKYFLKYKIFLIKTVNTQFIRRENHSLLTAVFTQRNVCFLYATSTQRRQWRFCCHHSKKLKTLHDQNRHDFIFPKLLQNKLKSIWKQTIKNKNNTSALLTMRTNISIGFNRGSTVSKKTAKTGIVSFTRLRVELEMLWFSAGALSSHCLGRVLQREGGQKGKCSLSQT